ncbi:unnamed protein product [Amoebophrya sp. A120]|nr:unnamed protein product [Amoebophrya sp. A120]|eukprot:GSA120T00001098001.1
MAPARSNKSTRKSPTTLAVSTSPSPASHQREATKANIKMSSSTFTARAARATRTVARTCCPKLWNTFLTMQRYAMRGGRQEVLANIPEEAKKTSVQWRKNRRHQVAKTTSSAAKTKSLLALGTQILSAYLVFSGAQVFSAEFGNTGELVTVLEDKPKFSFVSLAVSAMLLGSFAFMMAMFYLVNHPDEDMKRYSWQVISATISIFIAVLTFQGIDNTLVNAIITEQGGIRHLLLDFTQQFCWFWILQFALGKATGALGGGGDEDEEDETKGENPDEVWLTEEEKEEIELLVMFWGTLIAHINGFAAINSFSDLQQLSFFAQSPFHAILTVPIAFCVIVGLFHLLDSYRERLALLDGHKDDREYMWDAEAEECENDVAGLCLSFLTAQAVTFSTVGIIPDSEGELEHLGDITGEMYIVQFIWCLVFMAISVLVTRLCSYLQPEEESFQERILGVMNNWSCMSFSWTTLMLFRWCMFYIGLGEDPVFFKVGVALCASCVAFLLITALDNLSDGDFTSDQVDKALRQMILALAILVGFGWEQSFDVGVEALSDKIAIFGSHGLAKFLMTVFLLVIVAPAWKIYIIPTYFRLQEEHDDAREEAQKVYDEITGHDDDYHRFEGIPTSFHDEYGKLKDELERKRQEAERLALEELHEKYDIKNIIQAAETEKRERQQQAQAAAALEEIYCDHQLFYRVLIFRNKSLLKLWGANA